jgi:hypothetical protein
MDDGRVTIHVLTGFNAEHAWALGGISFDSYRRDYRGSDCGIREKVGQIRSARGLSEQTRLRSIVRVRSLIGLHNAHHFATSKPVLRLPGWLCGSTFDFRVLFGM